MNDTLTPQDIQMADQASGWKTPPAGAPAQSRADQIRSMAGSSYKAPDTNTPNPIAPGIGNQSKNTFDWGGYFGNVMNDWNKAGTNAVDTAVKGGNDIAAGVAGDNKAGAQGVIESTLGQASNAVGAIFAPFTEGIKSLSDVIVKNVSDNPTLQKIAQTKGVGAVLDTIAGGTDKVQAFATAHPNVYKDITDALNVGMALIGEKIAPEGDIAQTAKNLPADLKTTATDVGTGIKNTVSDTATAVKEKIVGTPAEQSAKAQTNVVNTLKENADTMTPTQKKEAIDQGRQTITTTKTGGTKVDYTPSKEIVNAGRLLQDTIKKGDNPNVVLTKVKNEISTRGKAAETYLDTNSKPITNKEAYNAFDTMKQKASNVMTDTQMKAYNEQIKLFSKQLNGRGSYTTANYYKALKDWETNIGETLPRGKAAIMDPTGVANANIRAAADIRSVVRDMIGSKHPDFKPQMYDLFSLYKAKDVAIQNASKVKTQNIFEKHPVATKVAAGLGAEKAIHAVTGFGF